MDGDYRVRSEGYKKSGWLLGRFHFSLRGRSTTTLLLCFCFYHICLRQCGECNQGKKESRLCVVFALLVFLSLGFRVFAVGGQILANCGARASRASHSRAVKAMVSSVWWSHMMIPTRGLLSGDWLAGSQTSSRNHGITRFCFYLPFFIAFMVRSR